jgi:hypothetical protein
VSLILYHIKSLLRHASTTVTRSLAATVSVCLVLLNVSQPAVGRGVRVTPSPRMFTVKIAPVVVSPNSMPVTCEDVEASGM